MGEDGILNYELQSTGGDFVVGWAGIIANVESVVGGSSGGFGSTAVPDGGMAVTLLGLSLAGIGYLRRKLA